MQIGLLNRYLEHQFSEANAQHGTSESSNKSASESTRSKDNIAGEGVNNQQSPQINGLSRNEMAEYQPSPKTLLLTAIAEDFDVTDLALNQVDDLERQLQAFDLLTPMTQNAMQMLHRLRGDHNDLLPTADNRDLSTAHINAVSILKYKQQQLNQQGADLYQRRQVTELVRLFSNLESAHAAIADQSALTENSKTANA